MWKRLIALSLVLACLLPVWAAAENEAPDAPQLLPEAQWIWSGDTENNVWVDFITTFTLEQVPEEAPAEIGAENKYYLYVNGQQVVYDGGLKRGPNPTDGWFDTVDIAPYLVAGPELQQCATGQGGPDLCR